MEGHVFTNSIPSGLVNDLMFIESRIINFEGNF